MSNELEVEERVTRRTLAEEEENRPHDGRRRGRPRGPRSGALVDEQRRRDERKHDRRRAQHRTCNIYRIAVKVGRDVRGDAEPHTNDREHGDRHVHQQQDLPWRDREHEAARRRADRKPDQTHGRDEVYRAEA